MFSRSQGIQAAIVGTLIGSVAFIAIQLPVLYKIKYRHSWKISLSDKSVGRLFGSVVPVMAVALLAYGYTFVDIAIGTKISEGTVTAINVATKLIQLPQGVIAMGLTTVSFPIINQMFRANQLRESSHLVTKLSILLTMISALATVLILVQSDLIISIVFGRGTFGQESVSETSRILSFLVLSLPPFTLNVFLLKAFYAMKRWKTPVLAFSVAFVFKITLAFVLVDKFGVDTVAISTVVSLYINSAIMIIYLNNYLYAPFGAQFWRSALKIALVCTAIWQALSSLRTSWIFSKADYSELTKFVSLTTVGTMLFIALGLLVLRKEMHLIKRV